MNKDTIRNKIYSKIDELPTLPSMVTRLLALFDDKRSNTSLVTEVIKKDPALAAKILKVANSAYYGFSQKISDLERAVALLGFNMVKSLAVSIGVMNCLPVKNKTNFSGKKLWHHSVTVAVLLREMGKHIFNEKEGEHLFILGLLHDVGMIVFDQFFSDKFQEVLEEAQLVERNGLYNVEKKVIGLDHGEVGGMLLTRWNFPAIISMPVTAHHHGSLDGDELTTETALLKVGDIISHYDVQSEKNFEDVSEELHSLLKCLKTSDEFIPEIINFRESAKDEITSFFDAVI